MIRRILLVAALAAVLPLAAWAKGDAISPVSASFGDREAPMKDPFPPEALETGKAACTGLLNQRVEDVRGRTINLCGFKGKVLLVVNTASQCGYTPQYKGLQELQSRYSARGLVVLGFPSNDFGQQEPGNNQEIQDFCEVNYGVTFPLFSKVTVLGPQKLPFFQALTSGASGDVSGEIRWNFEKFLIGRDGKLISRYRSGTEPDADALVKPIEKALGG
ncbi:MAG TPA: glutathione peroxidase [bacterium]